MDKEVKIGRLAMRVEGDNWTAYYALENTMDGAIYLGQIKLRFVADKARKNAFMGMMKEAVSDILEEASGTRPTWPEGPHVAPEHERAGRG